MKLDRRYKYHQAMNNFAPGLFAPITTLFALDRGMSLYQVGIFFGIYYVSVILTDMPSGALADRFGRLKLYCGAKILEFFYFTLLVLVDSIEGMMLISILGGMGRSVGNGTVESWYYERLRVEDRLDDISKLLSSAYAWGRTGAAIGSLLGAGLVHFVGFGLNLDDAYQPTLALAGAVHCYLFLTVRFYFREGEKIKVHGAKHSGFGLMKQAMIRSLQNPTLRAVLILQGGFGMLLSSLQFYWQPVLQSLLNSKNNVILMGFVSMAFYLSSSISSAAIARLLNKTHYPSNRLITPLYVIACASMMLLTQVQSVFGFVILYVSFGFFMLSVKPLLATIMHGHVNDKRRATSLSLLSLLLNFGGVITGSVLSGIAEIYGIDTLWLIMGCIGLLLSLSLKNVISTAHLSNLTKAQRKQAK